jgi:hypothetical protein
MMLGFVLSCVRVCRRRSVGGSTLRLVSIVSESSPKSISGNDRRTGRLLLVLVDAPESRRVRR